MNKRLDRFAAPAALLLLLLAGPPAWAQPARTPAAAEEAAPAARDPRARAAERAARHDPACVPVQPFYWSIGDRTGVLGEGRAGDDAPTATTAMPIASSSKWVYSAYVAEQRAGRLSADDVRFLTFRSGYTDFRFCRRKQSVGSCDASLGNGRHEADNDGKFYYNGGHMQKHAVQDGLGPLRNDALADAVNAMLGTSFTYTQPQLAGGIRTTAADYGRFLRRIVAGDLQMKALLGTHAVCTDPATCATAVYSPMAGEDVHYSIGHWVEDDPVQGDGAFSSAGAFGFYPWIDAGATLWGVLARVEMSGDGGQGIASMMCGRRIRAAWVAAKPA